MLSCPQSGGVRCQRMRGAHRLPSSSSPLVDGTPALATLADCGGLVSTPPPRGPTHPLGPTLAPVPGPLGAPSSVHLQETTEHIDCSPSLEPYWTPDLDHCTLEPPTLPEDTWHHSGWAARRHLVYERMIAAHLPWRRLAAFAACGSGAWVEHSNTLASYRIRANYCHDRHCLRCATARGIRIAATAERLCGTARVRFVTLTIRSDTLPLADQLTRLRASFRELRRSDLWKSHVTAGLVMYECTYNTRTSTWHPHLHAIVTGSPVPQRDLAAAWHRVTGDSYIVDIRLAQSVDHVIRYVCRYATKSSPPEIWHDPDRATEFILATRGLRLAQPIGDWVGADLEADSQPSVDDWTPCGRLDHILIGAQAGDPRASRILWALARRHFRTDDPALACYLYPNPQGPSP